MINENNFKHGDVVLVPNVDVSNGSENLVCELIQDVNGYFHAYVIEGDHKYRKLKCFDINMDGIRLF